MNTKICKECGKPFKPKSPRQNYCKDEHYRPCPICNKPVLIKNNAFNDPPRCCSRECAMELKRKTCLQKYGTPDPGNSEDSKAKRRKTNLERYGVDNPSKCPEIISKISSTMMDRYGVSSYSQLPECIEHQKQIWKNKSKEELDAIKSARKSTCLNKYGVDNPRKSEEIKEKTKQTLLNKYGVTCSLLIPEAKVKTEVTLREKYGTLNFAQVEQVKLKRQATCQLRYGVPHFSKCDKFIKAYERTCLLKYGVSNPNKSQEIIEKRINTNMKKYGVPAAFMLDEHTEKCRKGIMHTHRISNINIAYSELLQSLDVANTLEFPLESKWFDIRIDDSNILIEIDPTYTHSTQPTIFPPLDKMYHKSKSDIAELNGYRCIHIFDWDDSRKIANMLQPATIKIGARKCKICTIDYENSNKFFSLYHLQNSVRGQAITYAAIYEDEIVSAMSFGQPRYAKQYEWELLRYATKYTTKVSGVAERLFHSFVEDFKPISVISYCDLSKFTGKTYLHLGFTLKRVSPPSCIWSKGCRKITDNLLRQRGYDQLFKTNFGKGSDNATLMLENGWLPVYDCGQGVYTYKSS